MKISTLCKYIDQPMILNKLDQKMPALLIGAGGTFGIADSFRLNKKKDGHKPVDEKQKFLKNMIVISSTIGASLLGTRGLKIGGKKIFGGLMERVPFSELQKVQTEAVEKFLQKTNIKDQNILKALETAKLKELSPKQIDLLIGNLPKSPEKEDLFSVILPEKKNLNSKEIFSEIKRLSLLGLIPVTGGVAGGIIADKTTHTDSKKQTAYKLKEGLYQYLANIFLCNVGAGTALFLSERLEKANKIKPLTPMKKLAVIMAGITATGIVGGSYIANYVSKKCINPLFGEKKNNKGIYNERKPEAIDIALHADDIATAGILSGFKWIEPALPFMYFVSGYRAGIGYRNVNLKSKGDAREKYIQHRMNNDITPECINKIKPVTTKNYKFLNNKQKAELK